MSYQNDEDYLTEFEVALEELIELAPEEDEFKQRLEKLLESLQEYRRECEYAQDAI